MLSLFVKFENFLDRHIHPSIHNSKDHETIFKARLMMGASLLYTMVAVIPELIEVCTYTSSLKIVLNFTDIIITVSVCLALKYWGHVKTIANIAAVALLGLIFAIIIEDPKFSIILVGWFTILNFFSVVICTPIFSRIILLSTVCFIPWFFLFYYKGSDLQFLSGTEYAVHLCLQLMTMNLISFVTGWIYNYSRRTAFEKYLIYRKRLDEHQIKSFHGVKLASLAQLTDGFAHEIRNPLAIILGSAERIKIGTKNLDGQKADQVNYATERIVAATKRIDSLISTLGKISIRNPDDKPELIPFEDIMEDIMQFFQKQLEDSKAELMVGPITQDVVFLCIRHDFYQILLNIISNAFEAISKLSERWIRISAEEKDGKIFLAITDSGRGIPTDFQEKIFDPFFTTKRVGEGTGLGLSISYFLAKNNKGEVFLDAKSPNTKFVIVLPSHNSSQKIGEIT
ncbi:MAG: GHKL domain-containing protein [Oligoflexales bacterium]|nr:GHKL domain-containing protein [Oligoflexales bacterium]